MDTVRAIGMGIVGIGLVTALFSNGRQTVGFTTALGTASQKVLYTAESGKLG